MKASSSFKNLALTTSLLLALGTYPAYAGGLLGDLVNKVVPGAGTALDDAHRSIKNFIPPYRELEEGATRVVNETLVQTAAPILEQLIIQSRNDALRSGVHPIPRDIRRNLEGFVSNEILDLVRYRVRGSGELSLQRNSFRYGKAHAITLDYVVVFKNEDDANYNSILWVHELKHVEQFRSWGVRDFSIRYLRSHRSVENAAYEEETRYVAWAGIQNSRSVRRQQGRSANRINRPVASFRGTQASSSCRTPIGMCRVNGMAPVGTPCWCDTPRGRAVGSLTPMAIPARSTGRPSPRSPRPSGYPSGYGMKVCGCWGPNPQPLEREPRCQSGNVRVNVCPGFCAPGHPRYAYVCR